MVDTKAGLPPFCAAGQPLATTSSRSKSRRFVDVRTVQSPSNPNPLRLTRQVARDQVCNQQPTPLRPFLLSPTSGRYNTKPGIGAAFDQQDIVRPISERPPSLKPLDFGDSSLLNRMSLHTRQKSSTTLLDRVSIGRPTDFRRLEYLEGQRRSLVPLQLNPVVLRDSVPALGPTRAHETVDQIRNPPSDLDDVSYRATRGSPYERCQQLAASCPVFLIAERGLNLETSRSPRSRPALSTHSSSSSLQSLQRQALESNASLPSAMSRSHHERSRLKRKRSNVKMNGEDIDANLDREILELNTIVEERRTESTRPQSPLGNHVPAVAPSMAVRARSETLTDIGSAFSRPLVALQMSTDSHHAKHEEGAYVLPPVTPVKSRLSQPFMAMPAAPVEDNPTGQHIRRPSSRVTGWLSNLLSHSAHARSSSSTKGSSGVSFVTARNRVASRTSLCTTVAASDSSAATAASSPTSKAHSRSITLTSVSAPSTVSEDAPTGLYSKSEGPLAEAVEDHSQVGLAL